MKKWTTPRVEDLVIKCTEFDPNGGSVSDGWWEDKDDTIMREPS